MNTIRITLAALLLLCGVQTSQAQGASAAKGFERFVGLRTRNIFDPDRRGPRTESAPSSTAPRASVLQLTGTMVTSSKTLAFFSGSQSDMNKVLPVQGKVGDYTVVAITPTEVSLEKAGKSITLPVGKQLSLDGTGSISSAQPITGGSSGSSSASTPSSTEPPAGVPADKAEVLRRMMERRQQEVSK